MCVRVCSHGSMTENRRLAAFYFVHYVYIYVNIIKIDKSMTFFEYVLLLPGKRPKEFYIGKKKPPVLTTVRAFFFYPSNFKLFRPSPKWFSPENVNRTIFLVHATIKKQRHFSFIDFTGERKPPFLFVLQLFLDFQWVFYRFNLIR